MSKIIILRGNSGSGKSTIAKKLQEKLGRGTLLISQDSIRREFLHVYGGADQTSINLLEHLVVFGNQNCKFTILEGILYADDHDYLFKQIEKIFKQNIFAYYFELPFEETLKRHMGKPNCNDFGESEMKRWWREKDYISCIDEEKIYKELNISEIVDKIYNDIKII